MTVVVVVTLSGADPAAIDAVVDVLWLNGAAGVATEEPSPAVVRLTSSFDDGVDPAEVAAAVRRRAPRAEVALVDDDGAWWDGWREHARPVVLAGGRIVLAPAWRDAPDAPPGALVVRIDPGRTFGSGAHATTRLVVEALADIPLAGRRVLDVGCGSGVLSVVAASLGAAEVVGVDVDPACVEATVANAAANGVADRVRATVEPLAALDAPFDVVVVNVLLPVLEALAGEVRRLAREVVVASGMLDGTEGRAAAALGPRWRLASRSSADGWTSALLRPVDVLT